MATETTRFIVRLEYALWGAGSGAVLGVMGWWLFGLAHSLQYDGLALDPVLRHWVLGGVVGFSVLGFVFKVGVLDVVFGALSAILHFEGGQAPDQRSGPIAALVFLVLVIVLLWFSAPT